MSDKEHFAAYIPGSLQWGITVASAAHIFFSPLHPRREELAEFIGKSYSGNAFEAWTVSDFTNYFMKAGGQPGDASRITRLLAAMERAGLLLNAGWEPTYPLHGQRYITQGTLSAQRSGVLWLSEVLGADLIIEAYKAVTVQISGGEGGPAGTGLILDESHILTNKHVVKDLTKGGFELHVSVPFGSSTASSFQLTAFMDKNIDVAILRIDPASEGHLIPLPGMTFRDPAWADEVYLLGYPRVPWMVGSGIILQRGEVVYPMGEAPPIREKDMDEWEVPERTKMFLYSAIARPGNSGGPIIAHDGRVIGIVVQDSMATSSSDPDAKTPVPIERTEQTSTGAQNTASQEDTDLPDAAPFYRGIPASEILHALRNIDQAEKNPLKLEALITFENPLTL